MVNVPCGLAVLSTKEGLRASGLSRLMVWKWVTDGLASTACSPGGAANCCCAAPAGKAAVVVGRELAACPESTKGEADAVLVLSGRRGAFSACCQLLEGGFGGRWKLCSRLAGRAGLAKGLGPGEAEACSSIAGCPCCKGECSTVRESTLESRGAGEPSPEAEGILVQVPPPSFLVILSGVSSRFPALIIALLQRRAVSSAEEVERVGNLGARQKRKPVE